jgi:hypothetical protein
MFQKDIFFNFNNLYNDKLQPGCNLIFYSNIEKKIIINDDNKNLIDFKLNYLNEYSYPNFNNFKLNFFFNFNLFFNQNIEIYKIIILLYLNKIYKNNL